MSRNVFDRSDGEPEKVCYLTGNGLLNPQPCATTAGCLNSRCVVKPQEGDYGIDVTPDEITPDELLDRLMRENQLTTTADALIKVIEKAQNQQ